MGSCQSRRSLRIIYGCASNCHIPLLEEHGSYVPAEHADSLINSRLSHYAAGESWNKVFQRNMLTASLIADCHTSPLASHGTGCSSGTC
jgi:hypothetical protein